MRSHHHCSRIFVRDAFHGESTLTAPQPHLSRKLTLYDAVLISLGSMIGAGVFIAFAPAADVAGFGLLIGLVIAATIAWCNAMASAQLAAQYPESGGTYIYGRKQLNNWAGFIAGWGFVIGKTASCTAMALTFAANALPNSPDGQKWLAIAAVASLAALNYRGITRTAMMTRLLVSITLIALAIMVLAMILTGSVSLHPLIQPNAWEGVTPGGILRSSAFLFFAFAGYARIATMGEEVRNPTQVIPMAISISLGLVVTIYVIISVVLLGSLSPDEIANSRAPLTAAVEAADLGWIAPLLRIGAMMACLGALLNLLTGVSRTSLAMARNQDMPAWLATIHPIHRVPYVAEITQAAVIIAILLIADTRGAIGFSSFGVLIYYTIANLAAISQASDRQRWPRFVFVLGALGCISLVFSLPIQSLLIGAGIYVLGIAMRLATTSGR